MIVLLLCVPLWGCFTAVTTSANAIYNRYSWESSISDYSLYLRAQRAIDKTPAFVNNRITVSCYNRILLLTGQVDTENERRQAATIVSHIEGVTKVYNCLSVSAPLTSSMIAKDSWITTKIKTRLLATNGIDQRKVKVITENGIVYLMGVLPPDQAEIAAAVAQDTSGVKKVVKVFQYLYIR